MIRLYDITQKSVTGKEQKVTLLDLMVQMRKKTLTLLMDIIKDMSEINNVFEHSGEVLNTQGTNKVHKDSLRELQRMGIVRALKKPKGNQRGPSRMMLNPYLYGCARESWAKGIWDDLIHMGTVLR